MIGRSFDCIELDVGGMHVVNTLAQLRTSEREGRNCKRAEGEKGEGCEGASRRRVSWREPDTLDKVCESDGEILAAKFFRLEGEFAEEVESAGGQEATASGGEGFEGDRIIVQEVDDGVGEFGSKMSERHGPRQWERRRWVEGEGEIATRRRFYL